MKNLKTFEQFSSSDYEGSEMIDEKIFGRGGFLGGYTLEQTKKAAQERFKEALANAKKFDSDPAKVAKAKERLEKAGYEYRTAEESIWEAILLDSQAKNIMWFGDLGVYATPMTSAARGMGGAPGGKSRPNITQKRHKLLDEK